MGKLTGKTAVIIGGSTGMALETAREFVNEGAYVFITGRRAEVLTKAVEDIGYNIRGVQGDITDLNDLERLYEEVKRERGQIDILFVSAAIGQQNEPIASVSMESFHKIFVTNVRAPVFAVQKALPLFSKGGSIILNSSIANVKGLEGAGLYSASKAALRSLARTLAMELRSNKIRVNSISPGPIDTPFTESASEDWKSMMTNAVPLGRFGKPKEIASAVLFLASDDSSFINGIDLYVDGGLTQV